VIFFVKYYPDWGDSRIMILFYYYFFILYAAAEHRFSGFFLPLPCLGGFFIKKTCRRFAFNYFYRSPLYFCFSSQHSLLHYFTSDKLVITRYIFVASPQSTNNFIVFLLKHSRFRAFHLGLKPSMSIQTGIHHMCFE